MTIEPFTIAPKLVERVWGGQRLGSLFGGEPGKTYGELWCAYDDNLVASGPFQGQRLADVLAAHGPEILGQAVYDKFGPELPLLIKLIDTAEWLSVQVHPDDAYAHSVEAHTGFHGKSEAWVILDAEPGAKIAHGFRETLTPAAARTAALDGTIMAHLRQIEVGRGDVVDVPAGTVHAIGPGLLLYEVQQRSDLTYRMYDFGRGRDLHLDKALAVARLAAGDAPAVCARFFDRDTASVPIAIGRLGSQTVGHSATLAASDDRFLLATYVEGAALPLGTTVLMPLRQSFAAAAGKWFCAEVAL